MKLVAQDLFGAGTFTTMEHFLFFLRVAALDSAVQEAMRAEIRKVTAPPLRLPFRWQWKWDG